MQDFFFATFLYSAILSFVCCLRYQPKCAKAVERTTQELPTEEPQQADIDQALTDEIEQKLEPAHALIEDTLAAVDEWDESAQIIEQVAETVEEVESFSIQEVATLDPRTLTLRQCRAVIREINKGLPKEDRIRQKINGKDAPTDWLRVQIARQLEAQPASAMVLEEVS
jgi:hypothetical protein